MATISDTTIRRLAQVAFWLAVAAIAVVTLSPIEYRPMSGHTIAERFLAYMVLGGLAGIGYGRRPLTIALLVSGIALGLEGAQALSPTRHAHWQDAFEKVAGGILGVGLGLIASGLLDRVGRRDG